MASMRSVALGVVAFAACGDDGASHVRADSVVAVDSTAEGCWTCDDDSALEPNDSIQVAHVISTYVMDGLSICPVGDKDYYAITIPIGGSHPELLVLYEAAGAEVHGRLAEFGRSPARKCGNDLDAHEARVSPEPAVRHVLRRDRCAVRDQQLSAMADSDPSVTTLPDAS
jgi:hypothetical protein